MSKIDVVDYTKPVQPLEPPFDRLRHSLISSVAGVGASMGLSPQEVVEVVLTVGEDMLYALGSIEETTPEKTIKMRRRSLERATERYEMVKNHPAMKSLMKILRKENDGK